MLYLQNCWNKTECVVRKGEERSQSRRRSVPGLAALGAPRGLLAVDAPSRGRIAYDFANACWCARVAGSGLAREPGFTCSACCGKSLCAWPQNRTCRCVVTVVGRGLVPTAAVGSRGRTALEARPLVAAFHLTSRAVAHVNVPGQPVLHTQSLWVRVTASTRTRRNKIRDSSAEHRAPQRQGVRRRTFPHMITGDPAGP